MTDPLKVLVVDDDFMVARIHRGFVSRVEGFTVVGEARTGSDALNAVASLRPDLLLLDIYLPDRSGLEVLRQLRAEGNDVDVIAVTAAQDVETVRESLRGGVAGYLIKPFTFDTFRERLQQFAWSRQVLASSGQVEQHQVDEAFARLQSPPAARSLPKGLTPETARVVEKVLRSASGDLAASECATLTGLSRVSARRYLEHFVSTGQAVVHLRYGTTGRPERRYTWR